MRMKRGGKCCWILLENAARCVDNCVICCILLQYVQKADCYATTSICKTLRS